MPRLTLYIMFRNFLFTAIRIIIRDKTFSLINILGFSIGIACTVLILFWVQDELSYDQYHEHKDRIYRVLSSVPTGEEYLEAGVTPAALAPMLEEAFPEIEMATRFKSMGSYTLVKGEKRFRERYCGIAESKLFSIFTFPFIEGNPETCLDGPNSIVLTESLARKYFGDHSAMGEKIEIPGMGLFKVTSVIEDVTHCHFQFNYLIPFGWAEFFYKENIEELGPFNYSTYIMTKKGVNSDDLEKKIEPFFNMHADQNRKDNEVHSMLFLQNLTDIYLRSDFSYDFTQRGDIRSVWTFSAVALIILLIACINFMNLTTARAANRTKEIGVRKIQGANRKHLITQFYFESALITFLSFVIALLLVELTLPHFNNLSGKALSQNILTNPYIIIAYFTLAVITALIAGSFPALYLSAFHPLRMLKGKAGKKPGSGHFRRILVIVQFSISMALIVSTFVVKNQLNFISNKNLGYDSKNLCTLHQRGEIKNKYEIVRERLLASPDITHVSALSDPLSYAGRSLEVDQWEGNNGSRSLRLHFHLADHDIVETLDIGVAEGRSLSRDLDNDSGMVFLINETAVKEMGLENPVGKAITLGQERGRIVGVYKDFNYNTIHHKINAHALILDRKATRSILFRMRPGRTREALAHAEEVWEQIEKDHPFGYTFVDQYLDDMYRAEERTGNLFGYFTVFAILISCLGLLGLSSFMTQQRQKEIGIRKVMGSGVNRLILLLIKDFTRWVLLAGLIGLPLGYYIMRQWLQGFHYRTDLSFLPFFSAFLITFTIAVLTVGIHTYRASMKNPVDTLRDE
ncbi:MAG: ABC transporter permease [Bacteroidales bacterium]|nr:ABC transporter permease [Bacteroidales bacterium]